MNNPKSQPEVSYKIKNPSTGMEARISEDVMLRRVLSHLNHDAAEAMALMGEVNRTKHTLIPVMVGSLEVWAE